MDTKPYVQMPKPDEKEAERLLINLVESISYSDRKKPRSYYAARDYLEKIGVVTLSKDNKVEAHV